ncbi:methyltransferase domain-containing protein [Candidatus Woesearchaeota archaeon]|nr:methyltransferase domain-containing protein [Candidatus Woesearchaeota archaeon]
MKPRKFNEIRKEYDAFYKKMLTKGQLPMRSTELGFWNAAISSEVYSAFKKLNLNKFESFIDLGSGDGKITLIASLFCERAEGVEIDDELHEKALEMKEKLGIRNAAFHNDDFNYHSISGYDIVFINPDKPMSRGTEKKILNELDGKLVVYGHHFHPSNLKKEQSFLVDNTLVSVYSRK